MKQFAQRAEDERQRWMLSGRRIGPGAKDVTMAGAAPGKIWVRAFDDSEVALQAWGGPALANLECLVRKGQDGEHEVIRWRKRGAQEPIDGRLTPMSVYGSNFTPGRVRLAENGSLNVVVEDFVFNGRPYTGSVTITPPGTAGKMAYCPVVFDPLTGAFSHLTGALFDVGVSVSDADALNSVTPAQGLLLLGGFIVPNGAAALDGLRWVDGRTYLNPVEPQHQYAATTAPTATNDSADGYSVGSQWHDTTADALYACLDATAGAAVWKRLDGGATTIRELDGTPNVPAVTEIRVTNGTLTDLGGGVVELSTGGSLSVTDTSATVNPTSTVRFNPTEFDVDDLGSGTALVKLLPATVGAMRWVATPLFYSSLSAAGTFDLSSIAGIYEKIEIELWTRSSDTATRLVYMYANNDRTLTNYRSVTLSGGAAPGSLRFSSPVVGATTSSAQSEFHYASISLYNPASTTARKAAHVVASRRDDPTNTFYEAYSWRWQSTDAINRLTFEVDGVTNFSADSICRIVGYRQEAIGGLATEATLTLTGTQHNIAVGNATLTLLRLNNASDLTITGFAAGAAGQRVIVQSIGAGNVFLANENAGSTAANRLANTVTSINTPLAAGVGVAEYVYDATTQRWRLVSHEQGAALSYTPTWTTDATPPSVGNGTLTGRYTLRGRTLLIQIDLLFGTTTSAGTGNWLFALPSGATGAAVAVGNSTATDVSAGFVGAYASVVNPAASNVVPLPLFRDTVPFVWANTDRARVQIQVSI